MAGETTGRTSSGDQQSYQKSFFGQSVVIMIWNLNRTQKNMFIQNKRFYMRQ